MRENPKSYRKTTTMLALGFRLKPGWTHRHFPTFLRARGQLQLWAVNWFDKTFRLLRRIEAGRKNRAADGSSDSNVYWLLPYRTELRSLIACGHIGSIKIYLRSCPPEMEPVCIWLLGQCADRFRYYGFQRYGNRSSPKIRNVIAKALRRLEAWSLLNDLAAAYPDDATVQQFARAGKFRRTFAERLLNYKRDVDDSRADEVVTPSRMLFWSIEKSWEYTPPKNTHLIRRMLRRIQHWVRWGVG